MRVYNVIGLMSGTSLDGLDIVLVSFRFKGRWYYKIQKAITVLYPEDLRDKLAHFLNLDIEQALETHNSWADFAAKQIKKILGNIKPDLIASHGHTVIHKPHKQLTLQIGNGAILAAKTSIPTVCDFRSIDVALNGQGAPLVPMGEAFLFPDYKLFINLGGFANISFHSQEKIIAYDICPVNYVLNYMANKKSLSYDKNGALASGGKIIFQMLKDLENLDYYKLNPPKSLSDHWFFEKFKPIVEKYLTTNAFNDVIRTIYEHIALRLNSELNKYQPEKVLITGGGAKNKFLIKLLIEKAQKKIIIPDELIIDYKEAIIFAFLGLLRMLRKTNVSKTVTGAKQNNIGGALYYPFENQ